MKKTLFAIAAMVAMVACNNDYVVKEAAPEAISFENMFVDNATRSVNDPSFSSAQGGNMFSNFAVYGSVTNNSNTALIFDNDEVNKTITNGDLKHSDGWRYAGTQYWINGATYNFAAVAPYGCSQDGDFDAATKKTTIEFTNDGVTDLLYAKSAEIIRQADSADAVEFSFRHTLSKVKFSFTNRYNATNSSIRVKDIEITDAYEKGSVVLDDASAWTPVADSNTLSLSFGNAVADDTDTDADAFVNGETLESYNELFMIPGAGATDFTVNSEAKKGYTVTFTVELLMNGGVIGSYDHEVYTTFAPVAGRAYDIAAEINPANLDPNNSQEAIEFTVKEITGWDTTSENQTM